MAERETVSFPTEEEGMPGIHIDIKHDLGSGGDRRFSGAFHGAGAGGSELVDEHTSSLKKVASLGLDKAVGVKHGPGTAGAHPAMVDFRSGSGFGRGEKGAPGGAEGAATEAAGLELGQARACWALAAAGCALLSTPRAVSGASAHSAAALIDMLPPVLPALCYAWHPCAQQAGVNPALIPTSEAGTEPGVAQRAAEAVAGKASEAVQAAKEFVGMGQK